MTGSPGGLPAHGRGATPPDARLEVARARFDAVVEHSAELAALTDGDGRLEWVSPAWSTVTGLDRSSAPGTLLDDLLHPDDLDGALALRARVSATPEAVERARYRLRHADGSWRNIDMLVANHLWDPAVGGLVTNIRDVTAQVDALARLAHQATHDLLTDLPNRALFRDQLRRLLDDDDGRRRHPGVLLLVDLDRFTTINDTLGHDIGDRLLVAVADRLRRAADADDLVARICGDEFVLASRSLSGATAALELGQRLQAMVGEAVDVDGRSVSVGCSIGIAVSDGQRPEDLLVEADVALNGAKERGRNRIELYHRAMQVRVRRHHSTEQAIRHALDHGGIVVEYQPIVDLACGQLVGAEALVRLRLPTGGRLPAGEIVPVAEDTGLIVPLGEAVLDRACGQQSAWADVASTPERVSVNVSGRQLSSANLVARVASTLERHDLPAKHLCLELTESALISASRIARNNLDRLKELGVTLALDDFGTGWSSLAYLRRFPIDVIKIDRSFVQGLGHDAGATEVVRAVIGLGHALSLSTVAEGVETAEQETMLIDLGCDLGQGFRYGAPGAASRLGPVHGRPHLSLVQRTS